jgi:two-component system sensor histidine kinase YesM
MRDKLRTVKGQVILLMVLFALIVTLLVLAFSFYMMYAFQRETAVRSAEFNLRLVASVIEQDLRDLTALGKWCGQNEQIRNYFLSNYRNTANSLEAYYRMLEEFYNNRASRYVGRLIVFDLPMKKFLQVGNSVNASEPVTVYNLERIFRTGVLVNSTWQPLVPDPFIFPKDSLVIPFVPPVINPGDGTEIGVVFLAAASGIITDKLKGYNLPEDSELYLIMAGRYYRIEDNNFFETGPVYQAAGRDAGNSRAGDAAAVQVRDLGGKRRTLVSCPVRDGIAMIQVLSNTHFLPQGGLWSGLAAGLCALIFSLALIITLNLDTGISRPVARLKKRIDAISRGDFSVDPAIESDNELGQVGYGINRLAREITVLMDKRVADEKNKRDLEYRMLQSQINPHFLYNTLNSIKWMASIQHAGGIVEMTTALSRLLRTVSKDIRKVVPLEDELALLDDYIIIQKYRYGGSVTLKKQIAGNELLKVLIPRFTLQPLVENAIFHGIEPKGGGTITLTVTGGGMEGDVLVTIRDDGVGMSAGLITKMFAAAGDKSGMFRELGVHNVDERLRYAFGEGYGLSVASEEGAYTAVSIRLPHEDREKAAEAAGD